MKFTKKTSAALNLLFLAALLAAAFSWLGRALVPVTYAQYYRHDLDQMKEKGETYDLIFIGASRVYRSFDPAGAGSLYADNGSAEMAAFYSRMPYSRSRARRFLPSIRVSTG